jgi:bacteriocin-like protein
MDKYAKTELYLSDEQLQQITGGGKECTNCGSKDCKVDQALVTNYTRYARTWYEDAAKAETDGKSDNARSLRAWGAFHSNAANELQMRIDARHGTSVG